MSNPHARQEEIVVQEVFEEYVVYDLKENKVHLLNPTAALVWQHCDGEHTPRELADLLARELDAPQAEDLLWLTLDRLEKAKLLSGKLVRPAQQRLLTRRQMLKMAGVTLALLPAVKSIVAPTPARAVSCFQTGHTCDSGAECCSGECNGGFCT